MERKEFHPTNEQEENQPDSLMEAFGSEPSVVFQKESYPSVDTLLEEGKPMQLLMDYLNG